MGDVADGTRDGECALHGVGVGCFGGPATGFCQRFERRKGPGVSRARLCLAPGRPLCRSAQSRGRMGKGGGKIRVPKARHKHREGFGRYRLARAVCKAPRAGAGRLGASHGAFPRYSLDQDELRARIVVSRPDRRSHCGLHCPPGQDLLGKDQLGSGDPQGFRRFSRPRARPPGVNARGGSTFQDGSGGSSSEV